MPLVPFPSAAGGSLLWDGTGAKPPSTAAGQFLVDSRINRIIGVATGAGTPWVTVTSQHTYVGNGAWDNTKVDAAQNWGMPAGTKPDPVANPPAVGDVYLDTNTGSIMVFE